MESGNKILLDGNLELEKVFVTEIKRSHFLFQMLPIIGCTYSASGSVTKSMCSFIFYSCLPFHNFLASKDEKYM